MLKNQSNKISTSGTVLQIYKIQTNKHLRCSPVDAHVKKALASYISGIYPYNAITNYVRQYSLNISLCVNVYTSINRNSIFIFAPRILLSFIQSILTFSCSEADRGNNQSRNVRL